MSLGEGCHPSQYVPRSPSLTTWSSHVQFPSDTVGGQLGRYSVSRVGRCNSIAQLDSDVKTFAKHA
jgi:hypothetical protein